LSRKPIRRSIVPRQTGATVSSMRVAYPGSMSQPAGGRQLHLGKRAALFARRALASGKYRAGQNETTRTADRVARCQVRPRADVLRLTADTSSGPRPRRAGSPGRSCACW
jgi:hypothetical protein